MHFNHVFANIDAALPALSRELLDNGHDTGSRNGRTMEQTMTSVTLEHPWQREITLPGRKANIAAQIAETVWVLSGRNDIEFLIHYLPRAADFSDDGRVWRGGYGPRLRAWPKFHHIDGPEWQIDGHEDQLDHVVDLLRKDPLSRRVVMSIYNPGIDMDPGKDIPCNDFIIFSNRLGKLDMHVTVRSNDLIWGFSGINAFEWSALQEIVAHLVGVEVGALHFTTGSLHVYERHFGKAHEMGSLEESIHPGITLHGYNNSPDFHLDTDVRTVHDLDILLRDWMQIEEGIRKGHEMRLEIDAFPEPMLRSWLRVIEWWWTRDASAIEPLEGTRLWHACTVAMKPPKHPERDRDILMRVAIEAVQTGKSDLVRSALQQFGKGATRISEVTDDNLAAMVDALKNPDKVAQSLLDDAEKKMDREREDREFAMRAAQFGAYVTELHTEKDAAYGTSWKRRGEMVAILANIARKVDRLGGTETRDETSTDTAVDLFVYLVKYLVWLGDQRNGTYLSDGVVKPNEIIMSTTINAGCVSPIIDNDIRIEWLKSEFEVLTTLAERGLPEREALVTKMIDEAYRLAFALWMADEADAEETTIEPDPFAALVIEDDYRGADHE